MDAERKKEQLLGEFPSFQMVWHQTSDSWTSDTYQFFLDSNKKHFLTCGPVIFGPSPRPPIRHRLWSRVWRALGQAKKISRTSTLLFMVQRRTTKKSGWPSYSILSYLQHHIAVPIFGNPYPPFLLEKIFCYSPGVVLLTSWQVATHVSVRPEPHHE